MAVALQHALRRGGAAAAAVGRGRRRRAGTAAACPAAGVVPIVGGGAGGGALGGCCPRAVAGPADAARAGRPRHGRQVGARILGARIWVHAYWVHAYWWRTRSPPRHTRVGLVLMLARGVPATACTCVGRPSLNGHHPDRRPSGSTTRCAPSCSARCSSCVAPRTPCGGSSRNLRRRRLVAAAPALPTRARCVGRSRARWRSGPSWSCRCVMLV
jgi:hypothetical protein